MVWPNCARTRRKSVAEIARDINSALNRDCFSIQPASSILTAETHTVPILHRSRTCDKAEDRVSLQSDRADTNLPLDAASRDVTIAPAGRGEAGNTDQT
jgi:hypothetical protein